MLMLAFLVKATLDSGFRKLAVSFDMCLHFIIYNRLRSFNPLSFKVFIKLVRIDGDYSALLVTLYAHLWHSVKRELPRFESRLIS